MQNHVPENLMEKTLIFAENDEHFLFTTIGISKSEVIFDRESV